MSTFAWTIFLPCCCDHCEQIKTVTPETHGTFIDLVVFVFGGRGAGKQRQHSRSDGLSARQAGCHAASLQGPISLATPGSGRAAEKTGGWRRGRPGSCCQGGAERGTLAQASCQLKVITTAPTIPQIEGAGLPTPLCHAPLRASGPWAIPGFPGLMCIAPGPHFWLEGKPALK